MKFNVLVCILILGVHLSSLADSWPEPKLKSSISPDSNIVVRIEPGSGFITGLENQRSYEPAKASYYRYIDGFGYEKYQSVELLNPAAPIKAFVMNDGTLITIDNWYSTGSGKVLVTYLPDGSVRKSYELTELFSDKDDYLKLPRSISSIHWRCSKSNVWLKNVHVPHALGGHFVVDAKSGEVENIKTEKSCDEYE